MEVGGGVVFVDEAYQLNPQDDQRGRQVLDFLLVHAEKLEGEYGKLVFVFAGYEKNMDKVHSVYGVYSATHYTQFLALVIYLMFCSRHISTLLSTITLLQLFEHNPGLPSRFPSKFIFEDYSDGELLQIFEGLLNTGGEGMF